MAGDSNYPDVKLLLPFTGSNNSTTFTDTELVPKIFTAGGNAKIVTTQTDPFGNSNGVGYFDGTGDYLQTPDSSDFAFASRDHEIEFFCRPGAFADAEIMAQRTTGNSFWLIRLTTTGKIRLVAVSSGTTIIDVISTNALTLNVWTHVVIKRKAVTSTIALGGTFATTTTIDTGAAWPDSPDPILIGTGDNTHTPAYTGYLSQFRVTDSSDRYSSDFTPPTGPFIAGLGQLSGNITESALTTDWRVSAHLCSDGSLAKTGIFTGTTYSLDIPTLAPHNRTIEQKIDYNWSANKVSVTGDFMVPSNPESTPHLFKVTTGGDFGATEPVSYDTTPGNTTAAGAATLTCVGPLVDPVTNGPKIPA